MKTELDRTPADDAPAASAPPDADGAKPDVESVAPEAMDSTGPTAESSELALVAEACHKPFAEAWVRLEQGVARALLEPLRAGLARHQEILESIDLDGDPPTDWRVRSDRLLEYRRETSDMLIEVLSRALEGSGPAATIESVFTEGMETARTRCLGLSDEIPSKWPEGALLTRPSDPLRRRIGKAWARVASAARKPGKDRLLPLRTVALRHLGSVVVGPQDEAAAAAIAAWARWSSLLESAWLEWANTALPALIRGELPDSAQAEESWAAVGEAAHTLQARLEALSREAPHSSSRAAGAAALREAIGPLRAEVAVAGSSLLRRGKSRPLPPLRRLTQVAPAAKAFDQGVAARLKLYAAILAILSGATAVQRRLVYRCRERTLSRRADLAEAADGLTGLVGALRTPTPDLDLDDRLSALDPRVSEALKPALTALPSSSEVAAAISEIADSTVEALLAMIRQAPASLSLHAPGQAPPTGSRTVEARPLALQELARQSFDALRIERIRASTAELVSTVDDVREEISGLSEVFSFARDEATRELQEGEEGAAGRAVDLVAGALDRMAESLRTREEQLDAAVDAAQQRLAEEICEGSTALLGRIGAGRVQAQLLAARSRVADITAWLTDIWGPRVRRAVSLVASAAARARARVLGAVRYVESLLGREAAAPESSVRTLETLAEAQTLLEGLPLVYRRLFTFEPLSDPALLAGRASEMESATVQWERWRSREGVPLVVRARHRGGITSFLNAFAAQISAEGAEVARLGLDERVSDEPVLASKLVEALSIPPCESLEQVVQAIFRADPSSLPEAVVVDNLEHVYLRVPGGTDLIERLLTLMAETVQRIFWMGGISVSAWQLIRAAEPTAVSQIDLLDLPALEGKDIRTAILLRHKRSGLDVRYEESSRKGAQLRRKLLRLRKNDRYRHVLEDEFFVQLQRSSGSDLGLSLFQWLQSADFGSGAGVLMREPLRPDFSIFDKLSLTQNFTLKAFLEHRTLTLAEHDRIFRLPRQESYQILESLYNRDIVEPVRKPGQEGGDRSTIEVDLRYRARPLLTGAIISHLKGRNVVH